MNPHSQFLHDQRKHFLRRLRERFNLYMPTDYYNLLCQHMDSAPILAQLYGGLSTIRKIKYQKKTIRVLFDERYRKIDTCLPEDVSIKEFIQKQPHVAISN